MSSLIKKVEQHFPLLINEIVWVTDPNIPTLYSIHKNIIRALESSRFEIISSSSIEIYNGYLLNTYKVKVLPGKSITIDSINLSINQPLDDIIEQISLINYIPITFSIEIETKPEPFNIEGIASLIKVITEDRTNIKVIDVLRENRYGGTISENDLLIKYYDFDDRNWLITFYPITTENRPIYQHPDYVPRITAFELELYNGYQILSKDPLTAYAVTLYRTDNELEDNDFRRIDNIYLIRTGIKYNQIAIEILGLIENLRSEGHFAIPSDTRIENDMDLLFPGIYLEIAELWNGKVKRTGPPMVIQSHIEYTVPTDRWYVEAAQSIVEGELPKYNIQWRIKKETTDELLRIRIKYVAIKSYLKLIDNNPLLSVYIYQVEVLTNLMIRAPFISYSNVEEYKNILAGEIYQDSVELYKIDLVNNFNTGIVLRWYLQTNNYNDSLIIPIDNNDYVISPTVNPQLIVTPDKDLMNKYRDNLIQSLRKYYSTCNFVSSDGQLFDPGLDNLTLDQLIKISQTSIADFGSKTHEISQTSIADFGSKTPEISQTSIADFGSKTSEISSIDTYCFFDDTLNYLFQQSPLGVVVNDKMILFTDSLISSLIYKKLAYRGYFNINIFTGILPNMPTKMLYRPNIGTITINEIMESEKYKLYRTEVAFFEKKFISFPKDKRYLIEPISSSYALTVEPSKDLGRLILLFEVLLLKEYDNLKDIVEKLWECGWFLSIWARGLLVKSGKMSRYPIINDKILNRGVDSFIDGMRLIKNLEAMIKIYCKNKDES